MLLYALTKFVAYSLWCFLGLRLLSDCPSIPKALKFGAYRWLLGLFFGVCVGLLLGSVSSQSVTALYFGIYIPLRVIEWFILANLIASASFEYRLPHPTKVWPWILGGIVVSFASDLMSPDGIEGRFCVGRCLC